jgi:hypothetical protein
MTSLFDRTNPEPKSTEQGTTPTGRVKTGIVSAYVVDEGKPMHGAVLTNLDRTLPFKKHEFTSKGSQICLKSPFLFFNPDAGQTEKDAPDCPWCKEKDRFDKSEKKFNRAKEVVGVLMYVLDRVGQVKEIEKDNGEKIKFDVNPICVMDFKRGPDSINLKDLIAYDNEGALNIQENNIWAMEKYPKEAKKAVSIVNVGSDKIKIKPVLAKFKNLPDGVQVAQEIFDRFNLGMTVQECRGLIFNAYVSDPKLWDLVDKSIVAKPQPVNKEEKPETDVAPDFEAGIE